MGYTGLAAFTRSDNTPEARCNKRERDGFGSDHALYFERVICTSPSPLSGILECVADIRGAVLICSTRALPTTDWGLFGE